MTKPIQPLTDKFHRELYGFSLHADGTRRLEGTKVEVHASLIRDAVKEHAMQKGAYDMLTEVIATVCDLYPDLPISHFRDLAKHETMMKADPNDNPERRVESSGEIH